MNTRKMTRTFHCLCSGSVTGLRYLEVYLPRLELANINYIIISSVPMATPQAKAKQSFIPEKYQDIAAIGFLALAVILFFSKAIFGHGFSASDNIASISFQPYLKEALANGQYPLWMPYIFSGLPGYAALLTTGDRTWDILGGIVIQISFGFGKLFGSDTARVSFWYIVYAAGMYLLMRSKKHDRLVSLFTALTAVFSTWVLTWIMIGHNTKPIAFSMFPYILMCLERIREKWSLLYAALLVVAVHIMIESTHLQMAFYGICTFGLYLLFELISRSITKQQPMGVLRAAGVLAVAGGLSYAMASDRIMSTLEYTPYSTRGSAPIGQLMNPKNDTTKPKGLNSSIQDANGGNDYEYSTNWSFSPEEMMTFLVPNFYGFGKLEYKGVMTGNRAQQIPSYYGQMPFTDAANYMGIGVLFLGLLGAFKFRRDTFVQFLFVLALFSLLISFGKHFSIVYDLFYNFVPNFNKFRAPSMALAMMQFAMPILAAYGITSFFAASETKDKNAKKAGLYFVGVCATFLVLGVLYGAVGESGFRADVENSAIANQYFSNVKSDYSQFVFDSMQSDWLTTGFLAVLIGAAVWMYVNNRLSKMMFLVALIALSTFDLIRVGTRPMEVAKRPVEKEVFAKTDVIDYLQSDKSTFRIADINGLQSPNIAAYHKLENIHGYHSAKMRVYQDLMDEAGKANGSAIVNQLLWNIMNVKYIVTSEKLFEQIPPVFTSQSTGTMVYQNPTVLPRAFFVKQAVVAEKTEILKHLKAEDFNPLDTCYVEQAITGTIETPKPEAKAVLAGRTNESMTFDVTATGNNLLFVGEVYYPVSWKAYLDGKEIPIHKTNFAFRSVVVPTGNHKLEFIFTSEKFEQGKTISLASNILVLLALIGGAYIEWKSRKNASQQTAA
ncbi:MAG: hypothetical protein JNL32_10670 [Candidatus Kapabacteria bacterium]|nr:hypothetical protein [Candidatus Kapabacteria bacterium]